MNECIQLIPMRFIVGYVFLDTSIERTGYSMASFQAQETEYMESATNVFCHVLRTCMRDVWEATSNLNEFRRITASERFLLTMAPLPSELR
jgi:hypothetical protein